MGLVCARTIWGASWCQDVGKFKADATASALPSVSVSSKATKVHGLCKSVQQKCAITGLLSRHQTPRLQLLQPKRSRLFQQTLGDGSQVIAARGPRTHHS